MKIYEKPMAITVAFEAVNVIAISDMFDFLNTWGEKIGDVTMPQINLYD